MAMQNKKVRFVTAILAAVTFAGIPAFAMDPQVNDQQDPSHALLLNAMSAHEELLQKQLAIKKLKADIAETEKLERESKLGSGTPGPLDSTSLDPGTLSVPGLGAPGIQPTPPSPGLVPLVNAPADIPMPGDDLGRAADSLDSSVPVVTAVSGSANRLEATLLYPGSRSQFVQVGDLLADGAEVVRITLRGVTVKGKAGQKQALFLSNNIINPPKRSDDGESDMTSMDAGIAPPPPILPPMPIDSTSNPPE